MTAYELNIIVDCINNDLFKKDVIYIEKNNFVFKFIGNGNWDDKLEIFKERMNVLLKGAYISCWFNTVETLSLKVDKKLVRELEFNQEFIDSFKGIEKYDL